MTTMLKGIGTALLQEIVDAADNWLGFRRLELAVFADNAPAIRLYEKFGFEREGIWSFICIQGRSLCRRHRHGAVAFLTNSSPTQIAVCRINRSRNSDFCDRVSRQKFP